ncbi:TIGD6, partial [Cordylochernes scorpioides]
MTGVIFTDWLKKLDQIFKRRERNFSLILDNCPAHQIPEGLQNIKIRFLPALTTSALQPCGIIKALKDQYRKRMITYLLTCMEEKKMLKCARCFEALKQHQAIDVNYIDFLEVDKDVQVAGEQSIEEIVKEVMGKEEDEERIKECPNFMERIMAWLTKSHIGSIVIQVKHGENGFKPWSDHPHISA